MAKEKFDFIQPFKDIPKTLKGFPKNLVHIWKDPVNNSDEITARKKEIFPYIYLFGALTLVFFILYAAIPAIQDVMMIVAMIPAFGVIGCVFLLRVLGQAAKKFANLECDNCKKRIAFDENVKIKVLDKKFTMKKEDKTIEKDGVPRQSTITASGKETVTVEISCKCQDCGTEKRFTVPFVTMQCDKCAVQVPYVQSGAMLVQFECDVKSAYESGACNNVGTVHPTKAQAKVNGRTGSDKEAANGVYVTYNRSIEDLVEGYFGNEIQMK